jgi:hypothetical protein
MTGAAAAPAGRAVPAEPVGELSAVIRDHLLRHPEPGQRLRECQAHRPVARSTTGVIAQNREWSSSRVIKLRLPQLPGDRLP